MKKWLRQYIINLLWGNEQADVPPPRNGYDIRVRFAWGVDEHALTDFIENKLRQNWGNGVQYVKIVRRG